ncbi:MAG: GLUG motif-containing protein [Bacteroidota bacterium]
MKFIIQNSCLRAILLLTLGVSLSQCTVEEEFFPADPSKLSLVAIQSNGIDLENGKDGVKVDGVFTIIFSKPLNEEGARNAIRLEANGNAAALNISFNNDQSIVGITPLDSLEWETDYTLTIGEGSYGLEGETLAVGAVLAFKTEIEPMPLFAAGSGTEADPYQVADAQQMDIIRLFPTSYFTIINDIDLTEVVDADPAGWVPIGDLDEPFSGFIDGGGFTISGLRIDRTDQNEVGLFGVLASGELKNIKVNSLGIAGAQATGALVGRQLSGNIENCHSSGSVTAVSSRVGGLVGSQETGTVTRCSSSCGVFSELSRVGGLIGLSQGGTVTASFASGNCESLSSRVGGLVGSVEVDAKVFDSYATGNVTARNRGGGAFGRLDGAAARIYATGNVSITDADASGDYPGNVVGQAGSSSSGSDFYYPVDQVINYAGGADITTDGVPVNIGSFACANPNGLFPNFDFTSVWRCTSDGQWMNLGWE